MKFQIPKDATAMDILDAMDTWAANQDSRREPEKLWLVLTAARGPDSSDYDVKQEYTVPIRSAVLYNLAQQGGADVENWYTYQQLGEAYRYDRKDGYSHFSNHIHLAAEVILEAEGKKFEVTKP